MTVDTRFVDKAIEILEIMDECVAALEAAKLLRRAKEKAESRSSITTAGMHHDASQGDAMPYQDILSPLLSQMEGEHFPLNNYWGPLGFIDGSGLDLDIAFQFGNFEDETPTFLG